MDDEIKKFGIKFFCVPYNIPSNTCYQHCSVALAEGFLDLGISFFGNIDYWFDIEKKEYLIKREPKGFQSNIHIYDFCYFLENKDSIHKVDYGKINILIDNDDNMISACFNPVFSKFSFVLRSHYNTMFNYPSNVYPWAFGLTNRIINELHKTETKRTDDTILVNYRVPQSIRARAVKELAPILNYKYKIYNKITNSLSQKEEFSEEKSSYWAQTGRRHHHEYYELLNSVKFTFAFGGEEYLKPINYRSLKNKLHLKLNQFKLKVLELLHIDVGSCYLIYRFDSWRFWEAMLSNSIPIHMDFKVWSFVLPIMPENGVHYIGVKGYRFENAGIKILQLKDEEIIEISKKGKKWALEYYAPIPTALRLLEMIKRTNNV